MVRLVWAKEGSRGGVRIAQKRVDFINDLPVIQYALEKTIPAIVFVPHFFPRSSLELQRATPDAPFLQLLTVSRNWMTVELTAYMFGRDDPEKPAKSVWNLEAGGTPARRFTQLACTRFDTSQKPDTMPN